MPMPEREYHRLTRSRRRQGIAIITVARASLWLGSDHLLCIETNGYVFYFRDIQAIITRRNSTRRTANIVLAVLGALFLLIGFLAGETAVLATFCVLTFLLCLVPMLINSIAGPTCTCQIRTAVQTEDLPIGRVRQVWKILERIRPLIATAQGQLVAEEIPAQMQALMASVAAGAPVASPPVEAARYVVDDLNAPPRIIS
jgi:hypothetical protein